MENVFEQAKVTYKMLIEDGDSSGIKLLIKEVGENQRGEMRNLFSGMNAYGRLPEPRQRYEIIECLLQGNFKNNIADDVASYLGIKQLESPKQLDSTYPYLNNLLEFSNNQWNNLEKNNRNTDSVEVKHRSYFTDLLSTNELHDEIYHAAGNKEIAKDAYFLLRGAIEIAHKIRRKSPEYINHGGQFQVNNVPLDQTQLNKVVTYIWSLFFKEEHGEGL